MQFETALGRQGVSHEHAATQGFRMSVLSVFMLDMYRWGCLTSGNDPVLAEIGSLSGEGYTR